VERNGSKHRSVIIRIVLPLTQLKQLRTDERPASAARTKSMAHWRLTLRFSGSAHCSSAGQ
jgi:hypothetical protein